MPKNQESERGKKKNFVKNQISRNQIFKVKKLASKKKSLLRCSCYNLLTNCTIKFQFELAGKKTICLNCLWSSMQYSDGLVCRSYMTLLPRNSQILCQGRAQNSPHMRRQVHESWDWHFHFRYPNIPSILACLSCGQKVSKLPMEYDNHTLSLPIQCTPLIWYIIDVTTNNDVYEIMPVIINLLGRSLMIKTDHFNLLVHSVIVWLIQHCVCFLVGRLAKMWYKLYSRQWTVNMVQNSGLLHW